MVLNYTLIKLFKNGDNSIYYACCDEKMSYFQMLCMHTLEFVACH